MNKLWTTSLVSTSYIDLFSFREGEYGDGHFNSSLYVKLQVI